MSEQITEAEPSVSTEASFRTSALFCTMRFAPSVKTTVTTVGSPSGIAATVREIAVLTISIQLMPCSIPIPTMAATMVNAAAISIFESTSMRCCSGVLLSFVCMSRSAICPIWVCIPVDVTTPTPCPVDTTVPINAILTWSPSPTSSSEITVISFSTGRDSPVSAASSICRLVTSSRRTSAATMVPVSSFSMSPGTSVCAGIFSHCPLRITNAIGADMSLSESIDFCILSS